ncbi:MAG: GNAT family N-acetyltransferase [Lachnospiraceae bacterium]|nr:GNAT family N-acetyltransferase [Lachnospiraceae bacterium]
MDVIRKYVDVLDQNAVMRIWYKGNLEAHDFIPKEYWDRNFNYVKRNLKDTEVYVYEIEGMVVGFIGIDGDHVEGLFVDREYRDEGIGTRLINYIKEDHDFFTLHVFENNLGAIQFYENRGLIKLEESVHEDLGEVEHVMYYRKKKKKEEQ